MHPQDIHGMSLAPSSVSLCKLVSWRLKRGGVAGGRGWLLGRRSVMIIIFIFGFGIF